MFDRALAAFLFAAVTCVESTDGTLIPANTPQPATRPAQTIPMPQDVPLAPEPTSQAISEAPEPAPQTPARAAAPKTSQETPYDRIRRLFDTNYVPVPEDVNKTWDKTWDSDDPAMKDDITGQGNSGRITGKGQSGSITGQGKSGPITGKGQSGSITGKGDTPPPEPVER